MSLAVGFLDPIIAYASNLGGTTQACYTPFGGASATPKTQQYTLCPKSL